MSHALRLALIVALAGLWGAPRVAHAQYKNKAFGFDFSYLLITQPPLTDGNDRPLPTYKRGDRLHNGLRLGGEGSFKLHHDHWWFSARVGLALLGYGRAKGDSPEAQADRLAGEAMGTNLGVEPMAGVRYYILTDHFRPYIQASLSYLHIFSFGAGASATCADPKAVASNICQAGTYGDNFMPHTNYLAVHATPGFEVILKRDLGLHIILDYARWLVFSGYGNNVFTFGAGLTFYG